MTKRRIEMTSQSEPSYPFVGEFWKWVGAGLLILGIFSATACETGGRFDEAVEEVQDTTDDVGDEIEDEIDDHS